FRSLQVPAITVTSTLSLHDALPIYEPRARAGAPEQRGLERVGACDDLRRQAGRGSGIGREDGPDPRRAFEHRPRGALREAKIFPDRKSTRLNSSHVKISYAVFCLKK